ncbi:MAG: glutamine--fructose-6-phosphate transaminase (isomerizing), partial [Oscillospiraceae bacterium]|nr:glutamine--fructose-6-phosphate transaminase (isomerizing) [Oscillospiraceae bacterium]
MCGVVGYTGKQQAAPILLHGLAKLEYRGYDSAGLCVGSETGLSTVKARGKLKNLSELTNDGATLPGVCGIGHTRWATQGDPTDANAHPHVSWSGRFAVVHNGIIENFRKLKEFLVSVGVKFMSETDTEVVAQLIDYYYKGDVLEAVREAVQALEGYYALGIISTEMPGALIAARKDSPLIVAQAEGESFFASDVTAFMNYTRDVIYLDDEEIAVLTSEGITYYNEYGQKIEKEVHRVDWDADAAQKGGYAHFMLKEIYEQPKVCRDTVSPRIQNGEINLEDAKIDSEFFKDVSKIVILACGSAYHSGISGKYWLEKYARIPTEAVLASEFRYADPIVDSKTLAIVISQSGETADTLAALREAKRLGAKTLAIVNVRGSSITREAERTLYINAGPEIAVATTKAYTAQLAALTLIALTAAKQRGTIAESDYSAIVTELIELPDKMQKTLDLTGELTQYLSTLYFNHVSVFFIGRNLDYAASLEASLKLKEISYIHAETYAAGELKHGTISLIEEGTLVVAVAAHTKLLDKLESNIAEVKARGAEVLCLTQESGVDTMSEGSDKLVTVPDVHEALT